MGDERVEYYVVGPRPVKLVPAADGGLAVLTMNWTTGAFEHDARMLARVRYRTDDVEELTEDGVHPARRGAASAPAARRRAGLRALRRDPRHRSEGPGRGARAHPEGAGARRRAAAGDPRVVRA